MREVRATKQLFKGFAFGLLLQIAVGPVCVFVFNQANSNGLGAGLAAVAAVTLVDAVFVALAALGFAAVLKSPRVASSVRRIGAAVVFAFGLDLLLGVFGYGFLQLPGGISAAAAASPFLRALFLTASNPLSIVFWAGLFAVRIKTESESRIDLALFSFGAVAATPVFLTGVAALGALARSFVSAEVVLGLNALAGVSLLLFGSRMLFKTKEV